MINKAYEKALNHLVGQCPPCRDIELIPISWGLKCQQRPNFMGCQVRIDRVQSPFYEGIKYAVRRGSAVLNKDGEWHLEPIPSSRNAEFFMEFRFDSLEQAHETIKVAQ